MQVPSRLLLLGLFFLVWVAPAAFAEIPLIPPYVEVPNTPPSLLTGRRLSPAEEASLSRIAQARRQAEQRGEAIKQAVFHPVPKQENELLQMLFSKNWIVYKGGTHRAPRGGSISTFDPKQIHSIWKFGYGREIKDVTPLKQEENAFVLLGEDNLTMASFSGDISHSMLRDEFVKAYSKFEARTVWRITKYEVAKLDGNKSPKDIWGVSHDFGKGMDYLQLEGDETLTMQFRRHWAIRLYFAKDAGYCIGILEDGTVVDGVSAKNTCELILVPFEMKDNRL